MSVTRITSVHCDGCGVWHYANVGEKVASVRRDLRRLGWRTNVRRDDGFVQDFCRPCVERGKHL